MFLCILLTAIMTSLSVVELMADDFVTVDSGQIVTKSFLGFGAEWDIYDYPANGITDADFQVIANRVKALKLPIVRVMMMTKFCYLGNGAYDWNSPAMVMLYKQLDFCQKEGITVLLTDWGGEQSLAWMKTPGLTGVGDPQYATVVATYLDYLVNTRGYKCIKYFSHLNEPDLLLGDWSTYKQSLSSVTAAIRQRGLANKVAVTGPETSQGRSDSWLANSSGQMSALLGAYDTHNYALKSTVASGGMEQVIRTNISQLKSDSSAASKPFFMSEIGMRDDNVPPVGNPHIGEVDYGIFMADYGVQVARAGATSVLAWMLEDNGHKGFYWGMWTDKKSGMTARPWASSWSLLSRYFPYSATIYRVQQPNLIRMLVARVPRKSDLHSLDYSICLVNRDSGARTVNVNLAIARAELRTFRHYVYSDSAVATDAAFPNLSVSTDVYNTKGLIKIVCPPNSVTVLTTM
ncbi:cellulase family glycosylhydrolase [Geomonas sp. Red276]